MYKGVPVASLSLDFVNSVSLLLHTYDVAAHCAAVGTTPSPLGRDARTYAHMFYLGLRVLHALG